MRFLVYKWLLADLVAALFAAAFLMQIAPVDYVTPLLNFGAIGAVLLWFMFRSEPRLKALEDAMDRLSRAMLLDVMSREGHVAAKSQAQSLLTEVEG